MVSPHLCYILGFGFSLLIYLLGWSDAYPILHFSLLSFLIGSISAHFFLTWIWNKRVNLKNQTPDISQRLNPLLVTTFIGVLWIADFLYGGVPLFKILMNIPFDYKKFGLPAIHVLAVTLTSFYCVYLFQLFLHQRNKTILLLFVVNFAPAILVFSRAMLFFNLASCCFLYLLYVERIPYKKLLIGIPVVIVLFYLFGWAGTKRVSFESNSEYNNNFFLDNGVASKQFRESSIPKEFFWSYFYISSPLANLQTNINYYQVKSITAKHILGYINNELLFESISKRINAMVGIEREREYGFKDPFNVSTIYSRSYSYLGWLGMAITALVVLLLPIFYFKIVSDNPYRLSAIAVMCTMYLFMSYDNTIRLMGLGFQLVYPLVLFWIEKRLLSPKNQ